MPDRHQTGVDGARPRHGVRAPEEWELLDERGFGPFVTGQRWRTPDGGIATWSAHEHRKRQALAIAASEGAAAKARREAAIDRRLVRCNAVSAVAFVVGGSLFAIGAAVAQFDLGTARTAAWIYFCGGLFFNTGAYASLLLAINSPRTVGTAGSDVARWRWWSAEPHRADWLAGALLFVGTIVFGVNLVDSLIEGLSSRAEDVLIWTPNVVGCVLFIVSGVIEWLELGHGRLRVEPRDLGWWIMAVNLLGSALFMASSIGAFVEPASTEEVSAWVANIGTLAGALCFAAAGALQASEHPAGPGAGRSVARVAAAHAAQARRAGAHAPASG